MSSRRSPPNWDSEWSWGYSVRRQQTSTTYLTRKREVAGPRNYEHVMLQGLGAGPPAPV